MLLRTDENEGIDFVAGCLCIFFVYEIRLVYEKQAPLQY